MGYQIGKGRKLEDIIEEMSMVAEGVKTVPVVIELGEKYGCVMPIAQEVYKMVHGIATVEDSFRGLLKREIGSEADPL